VTPENRSRIGAQLYAMLPEVYRSRDASGDLRRYLDACGGLLDRVYATLRQRLDDNFPERCQPWLIPYFADLLDVIPRSPDAAGRRREVAGSIAWRQRKGTAAATEEIAEAVAGTEVELQEGWRRVARTARPGEKQLPAAVLGARDPGRSDPLSAATHPDLPAVTIDFRRHSRAQQAPRARFGTQRSFFPGTEREVLWEVSNPRGTPCFPGSYEDRSMRTVELRTPDWRRGHFHPKRLLAFVPVPPGFFPPGADSFEWDIEHPEQAVARGLLEVERQERRTIYRCPSTKAAPVRIRGAITLGDGAGADPEHVYRFEGFHLANTLTVKKGRLELARCAAFKVVVQQFDLEAPVLTATDCLLRHVQAADGLAQLEHCSVLGKTVCEAVQAIDCLFLGNLQRYVAQLAKPPQIVCLRHVRVPPELIAALKAEEEQEAALEPPPAVRRFDINRVQRYTTDVPVFFRLGFGVPGAGVLHPSTPASISAGAEDGGELGAGHHLYLSLRWKALREKFAEYLPFGMEAVVIPDERLSCVPPR